MKDVIITIITQSSEEDDEGVVTYPITEVFRFEFNEDWDHRDVLRELSEHPKCLDAVRLNAAAKI